MRARVSGNTWERTGAITQRHGAAKREEGRPKVLLLLPESAPCLYLSLSEPGGCARSGTESESRRRAGVCALKCRV